MWTHRSHHRPRNVARTRRRVKRGRAVNCWRREKNIRLAPSRSSLGNHSSISIGTPSFSSQYLVNLRALSHCHVLFAFFFFFWTFRRVEDHMRPLVQSAMRASAATERKERKTAASNKSTNKFRQPPKATSSSTNAHAEDASARPPSATARHDDDDDRPKEFATTSSAAPRRLNDVAMAPPELKKLPRGAAKRLASGGKAKAGATAAAGVLSMAQRAMMEVERENAIRRYREMKERKAKEGDRTLLRGEGDG